MIHTNQFGRTIFHRTTTHCKPALLPVLLSALAARFFSYAIILSSRDSTGGRVSAAHPAGAMIRFTTCRLCLDDLQPGVMATTSPCLSEELGSWTKY